MSRLIEGPLSGPGVLVASPPLIAPHGDKMLIELRVDVHQGGTLFILPSLAKELSGSH